ncbi:hypothetical protein M153_5440004913 [Pseudoloma neurophilia]|uniref:Uncharacterized protein n=1 Tax=Pseudoloma neurophilia TaxID=146866 RepID=A0A0R0M309_9MICR|nr:hypothetical protein M153_5440004913 [Pseudoloma neurophilia]
MPCIFMVGEVNRQKQSLLEISVKPNAKSSKLVRIENEIVFIDIQSPPDKDKANKELVGLLSDILKVQKSDIKIISGTKSRNKTVAISNLEINEILQTLQLHL